MSTTLSKPAVHRIPLDRPVLIEASAGTGKTWTIGGLYVRLLLQGVGEPPSDTAAYGPSDILVVTFTNAATAELRDRIRGRVVEIFDLLATIDARHAAGDTSWTVTGGELPTAEQDEFVHGLLLGRNAAWCRAAKRRLQLAARSMDTAAIYTIHGFCQRVLHEFSFETGSSLHAELMQDDSELVHEVLADFWRRHVASAGPGVAQAIASQRTTPATWYQQLQRALQLTEAWPAGLPDGTQAADVLGSIQLDDARLVPAYAEAARLWLSAEDCGGPAAERPADEFWRLYAAEHFNKNSHGPDSAKRVLAEINTRMAQPERLAADFSEYVDDNVRKYRAGGFKIRVKKAEPRHPFWSAFDAYLAAFDTLRAASGNAVTLYRLAAFLYVREELRRRKQALERQAFTDLLTGVANALDEQAHGDAARHLARQLAARYRVALIDEFQDTDPLQYRIFRAIFRPHEAPGALPIFLVGDPKQAIYAFRGADIDAYLAARDEIGASDETKLLVNQRSDEPFIDALNALFEQSELPFLDRGIPFDPAQKRAGRCRRIDDDRKALQFLLLPDRNPQKPADRWSKADANVAAADATAAEIAGLLGRRTDAGPIEEGDIAVLVPTHFQGRLVADALSARGIHYVIGTRDSVFAQDEADELERLLASVLSPADDRKLRAALVGVGMGRTAQDLIALDESPLKRDEIIDRLSRWHACWLTDGFMPMFRAWMRDEDVAERLLALPQGERRLTNFMQLAELLHAHAAEQGAGPEALLEWLAAQRQDAEPEADEQLLRLESDARRVRIVTIHTSKGLQYPIVFCPFLWVGLSSKPDDEKQVLVVHRDGARELHFGTPDTASTRAATFEAARRERLQEELRLLYVALTRAKHRCYVVWGHTLGAGTSALGWLLYGRGVQVDDGQVPSVTAPPDGAAVRARLDELAHACAAIGVASAPTGAAESPRESAEAAATIVGPRRFGGSLEVAWRTTSFSRLTKGVHSEAPDHDADAAERPAPAPPGRNRFSFPRGASAGTVLHTLFEECDFADAAAGAGDTDRLVIEALKALEGEWPDPDDTPANWLPTARALLRDVLTATLPGAGCTLASLKPEQIARELGFTYSLGGLDPQVLARLIEQWHPTRAAFAEAARRLDRKAMAGYMRGFIDLVFEAGGRYFVLDYKSNHLGNTPEDYDDAPMERAIADAHYYLQYLVYVVALHRHLKFVLGGTYDPAQHLGGVHYLFLRGVGTGPGRGIFFDRPPVALIEALDLHLGTRPGGDR